MTWLTSIAVSNAVVATVFGVVAYVVSRYSKNAALGHALWILVLAKLVTPPVLEFPVPVLPAWSATGASGTAEGAGAVVSAVHVAATEASDATGDRQAGYPGNSEGGLAAISSGAISAANALRQALEFLRPRMIAIWLVGIVVCAAYRFYVTWHMCLLMKLAVPRPRIDRAMHRIAKTAKVKNYPTARVVPWVGSPMLWGLGSTSVIVIPEQLFDSLDDRAADSLLQHELAHFQRRDQWVRVLEVVSSTLFWWHPVVWLAIQKIEVCEEQCCDAWVVQLDHDNRRRYAEALLDTIDFISEAPDSAMPIAASGLGRVPLLQQRLEAIMRGDRQLLSSRSRMMLVLLLALLPLQPKLLQAKFMRTADETVSITPAQHAVTDENFASFPAATQRHQQQTLTDKIRARAPIPEIEYAKAVSAYGTYEVIATSGYRAKLCQVVTGNSIDLSERRITCAAFAPPRVITPQLAGGCLDGSVWLFDCETGDAVQKLGAFPSAVHSLAYSPDGQWLAVGGQDGTAHLIELANPQRVRTLSESFGSIRSVRFSADGEKLAVVTDTTWRPVALGRVDIWDVPAARRVRTIFCPTAVGVAGFDALGHVLTAEWNGTLRTWSPFGEPISEAEKPKDIVSAAAFSPNAVTLEALAELDSVLSE